ncbi:NACHT domain-containing protein, partial [Acinetobacter oleivorans]|uniref:NACHT domain-containing protein n=1 Tax=Acinetobacter oleivorans TaxID=1148157 RepID=UPI0012505DD3
MNKVDKILFIKKQGTKVMAIGISTVALKAAAPTILKEVTTFIRRKYDNYKILNNLSENNEDLVCSISKLMSVKTLLTGADSPVNLFDFFQQPQLEYKKINFCINHIEQIKDKLEIESNNIVFKGTVGQGKSIFLRSLAIEDFIENKRIPVFIELKNISKSKGLIRLIKDYLSPWVGDNEEIFKLVLKSGKISIFLDAFDEVDLDLYQETYNSIDNLTKNYPELKIIITSRPETIILQNPNFYTISLKPYSFKEQKGLIEKIVDDKENQQKLIDSVRSSSFEVRSVLNTPLMVVLYIKQYTFGFSVPQHVSDFYKNIFDVVTFTHDKSKGIEKRKSFSNLNQNQLEKVFERFCFESFLVRKTVFDKTLFVSLLQKSLKKNNISVDIDYTDLINDYTRFACLILKDGSDYTFIHKSIQEYYVASFITNLPEALARDVIERKFIKESYFRFSNTNYIDFLQVLR